MTPPPSVLCRITGCDKPQRVLDKQLCAAHYSRWQRFGDPLGGNAPRGCSMAERFHWYIKIPDEPDACWIWPGSVVKDDGINDYGLLSIGGPASAGKAVLVHRWSYEHFIGPIPGGHEIDHLCRVHRCCNPRHLQPVTHRENMLRSVRLGRPVQRNKPECSVSGCNATSITRGWCVKHYKRWRTHGDPTVTLLPRRSER